MSQRNPLPTVDVVIDVGDGRIVLVRRRNPPPGWAIPGGFVDVGETAEHAAVREALEETSLEVELTELFGVYSDPARDPRHHTLAVVYLGCARGEPVGGDDAAEARVFTEDTLPRDLAFDHDRILADYFEYRRTGVRPGPGRTSRLSDADRSYLLRIARRAIALQLRGASAEIDDTPESLASVIRGAFVTLHQGSDLRGCIGSFTRDRPLARLVWDMAVAAAHDDPRFVPVSLEELSGLTIEISVLSELRCAGARDVVPGRHGVAVAARGLRGVLLPQVALDAGWDRQRLLAETCRKAGLPPDAWNDPETEISVFTAEVFGEPLDADNRATMD
jgi:8-oxo-dGTP diphosphatase